MEKTIKNYYKLTIFIILLESLIIFGTIYLYRVFDSQFTLMLIQNISYLISLVCVLLGIKISHIPFDKFGLFSHSLFKQISIGILGGFALLLFFKGLSFLPLSFNIYLILSQILVTFTEEMLFRGFLFTMIYEISKSKAKSIIVSSIIFGIYHYPLGHDIVQVISTSIIGLIYSGLRSVYFKTDKEIGIIPLTIFHWINNIF